MRAAVLHEAGRPMAVHDLALDPPQRGEVLVEVRAAGVCHSDHHYMSGDLATPLPVVLGHEGAGVVSAVGEGVSGVAPGDHVVLVWRPACGRCEFCVRGRPALCELGRTMRATGGMRDGSTRMHLGTSDVRHFLGVSCLAERCVVVEESLVRVPDDVPFEVAAILGCAVITGVGAVINAARVRPGSSVLVIGAGGVGLPAVMGAQLAGAARIIAADRVPFKLELAREFGATDVIDAGQTDLVKEVRRLTGDGVDYSFEVIGRAETVVDAVRSLRRGGVATAVGLGPMDARAAIPFGDLILQEKTLQGSLYGSAAPSFEIGRLIDLYRAGRLPLDRLVSRTYPLEEVNEAYQAMLDGEVARAVIVPRAD